jgi:hypothetical protein
VEHALLSMRVSLGRWHAVAALSTDMKQLLGAKQNAVMLSRATLLKQQAHHPELTLDEYRLIPDVIDYGKVINREDNKLIFFHKAGRLYKLDMKVTGNSEELFLTTFFRTTIKEMERDLRKGRVIKEGG